VVALVVGNFRRWKQRASIWKSLSDKMDTLLFSTFGDTGYINLFYILHIHTLPHRHMFQDRWDIPFIFFFLIINKMTFGNLDSSYGNNCAQTKPMASDIYIVPVNKSFGYGALTHNKPYSSTVYFSIDGAYPSNCTTFGYRKAQGSVIMQTKEQQ